jgi:hypothetical protein
MTDQDLLNQIQNALIEPPDGGQTWPSGLWSREEVLSYVNERQDRLIRETHMLIDIADIGVIPAYGVRHPLPDDWMATIEVLWTSNSGRCRPLARSDSFEADHGIVDWPIEAGTPKLYMDGEAPPLTLQIAPLPDEEGTLTVYYVPSCEPVDGNGSDLAVPDEFSPTLKYGALCDLLSKVGRANDPTRADYCAQRFQLGIEIAQTLLKGSAA